MCGIVGIASSTVLTIKEVKMFKEMLIFDTVRGYHSTGVISASPREEDGGGTGEYIKRALTAPEFLTLPAVESVLSTSKKNTCLIGHNRQATVGAITSQNAHPFHHQHIVGVHNGTLRSRTGLQGAIKYEVDSDDLFATIARDGHETVLPVLNGAFCLAWLDTEEQAHYLIRNDERPMFVSISTCGKKMMYASEVWMIIAAQTRNNENTWRDPEELPVGELWKIPLGAVESIEKKQVKIKEDFYGGFGGYGGYGSYVGATSSANSPGKTTSTTAKSGTVVPFKETKSTNSKDIGELVQIYPYARERRIRSNRKVSYQVKGFTDVGEETTMFVSKEFYDEVGVALKEDDVNNIPVVLGARYAGRTKDGCIVLYTTKDTRLGVLDN